VDGVSSATAETVKATNRTTIDATTFVFMVISPWLAHPRTAGTLTNAAGLSYTNRMQQVRNPSQDASDLFLLFLSFRPFRVAWTPISSEAATTHVTKRTIV